MPKRKRSAEEEVDQSFEKHTKDLFRALKAAKGFERQRLAKRSKDQKLGQETLRRLDHEVLVLKSLDLHQAAHAHLCSALLKVKAAAQSPHLPARLKGGVPKPDISDEERAALHNVTSALYKRNQVRAVMSRALPDLCALLGVPAPGSDAKRKEGASKQAPPGEDAPVAKRDPSKQKEARSKRKEVAESEPDSSDTPLEQDDDDSDSPADDELDEAAISRMEAMLGGSSSEGEGDSDEEEYSDARLAKFKSRARSFDDDISLPGSDSVPEDEDKDEPESESSSSAPGSEVEAESDASSAAAAPPPRKKKEKASEPAPAAAKAPKDKAPAPAPATKIARPTNSTFLPSLMGGYVSGSESASDVDVAPPARRNRRGQKARQAIWEKKYGEGAKHLGKPDGKRDAGWDARRGAVDPAADGKPWKRGVRNPLQGGGGGGGQREPQAQKPRSVEQKKPKNVEQRKRDDDGPLHPSWLAKKRAKQAQEGVKFEGKKVVFD
ncbi:hypothetical protein RB595_001106 [Gaeumannomyces hyphopodioides]